MSTSQRPEAGRRSGRRGVQMIRLAPRRAAVRQLATVPVDRFGGRSARPLAVHPHGPAFWVVLGVAALCAELAPLRPVLAAYGREGPAIVFNLVGGSFAACGLIAWRRRPDSRAGPLMTVTGFAFFAPVLLAQVDSP